MERLKELRKSRGKNQSEVARFLNITQQAYSNYEKGLFEPSNDTLSKMAKYFNVSVDYILGHTKDSNKVAKKKGIKIPILGKVIAGVPIEAIEDIIGYEEITEEMASNGTYFALEVKGDSMEPKFSRGDIVIVREQPNVENGEIAIVLVNAHEATVKKIKKTEQGIILQPTNPNYDPILYTHKDIERLPVSIIGKVVELRAKF